MKPDNFLWLPIVATVSNMLVALLSSPSPCHAQLASNTDILNMMTTTGDCQSQACLLMPTDSGAETVQRDSMPSVTPQEDVIYAMKKEEEAVTYEKDPMLHKIPGLDFEAYVRADIATFYNKQPGTVQELQPVFNGQAGKFVNISPEPLALYWVADDGSLSPINTMIPAFASGGTATFPGHKFVFVKPRSANQPLCTFTVTAETSVYYYDPFTSPQDDKQFDPARCVPEPSAAPMDIESLPLTLKEKYEANKFNFIFAGLYKNFTGGSEWLSMYPRNKPRHPMWRADYFGQEHHVLTEETHFHTDPGAALTRHKLSLDEMRRCSNDTAPLDLAEYRNPGTLNLTLKAASCAPRAFEIQNFLSDVEVEHILNHVKSLNMARSQTGEAGLGHVHSTRTSSNTWVPRSSDLLLNSIYRRAADVLRLDEALFRRRTPEEIPDLPTLDPINEDMQIVHYGPGQEYTAHHDFGYPRGDHPDSPSRSINLCMYLNDVEEGGETAFPRWRSGHTADGIKVKPEKGKAMIFYMVNPDGNLDDLTQHAAMPVIKGEKYFLNLWIHDPIKM